MVGLFSFLELNPISTEEVCLNYNELRNEIVLLNELKAACNSSDFELQSLKHQYETLNPDGVCIIIHLLSIQTI